MTPPTSQRLEPFSVAVPDAALDDLADRLARTRWPVSIPGAPWALGSDADTVRRLVERWRSGFDWRAQERALNRHEHLLADVGGTPVHLVRMLGEVPGAFPIVLTHGWPGSFLELLALGERLAHPSRHGGDPADACDVVIPSLPGFGFSPQRPEQTDPSSTPELWHRLMHDVLGYERYAAHGGDLGAGVTTRLAASHPEAVAGIHLLAVGGPDPDGLDDLAPEEEAYLRQFERWAAGEGAYEHQQQTRPVTLAYGLSDSPVGLLAWLVEKLRAWSDCGGDLATRFTDDEVLTWVSLYWLTNTITSSFRPYEDHASRGVPTPRVTVPTAVAVFPADLVQPPRAWAERRYAVARYVTMPRGGHFAAHEEPALLAGDITTFLRGLSPAPVA